MSTPLRGLDANIELTRFLPCLKAHGFNFAIRYYSTRNPHKCLTLSEAQALVQAGLQIGTVWEDGSPTRASYFSHAKGVVDGSAAYHMALEKIGQPANTPIYFAVDYDARRTEVHGVIQDYFEGIRDGFQAVGRNNPIYTAGVYGSGLTCGHLLQQGLVTHSWLSQSTGFQGSHDFAHQKLYNLIQFLDQDVCGINIDPDETNPGKDPGLFSIPVIP